MDFSKLNLSELKGLDSRITARGEDQPMYPAKTRGNSSLKTTNPASSPGASRPLSSFQAQTAVLFCADTFVTATRKGRERHQDAARPTVQASNMDKNKAMMEQRALAHLVNQRAKFLQVRDMLLLFSIVLGPDDHILEETTSAIFLECISGFFDWDNCYFLCEYTDK